MNTYTVEYSTDNGATRGSMTVNALDYTKAYLAACYALPHGAAIISVKKL